MSQPARHTHQVFVLSPANGSGKRAGWLLRKGATSPLAQRLRSDEGATIGEVFTFVSGLYFRGKLAYATAFANPPAGCRGVQIIVPGLGLRPPDATIDLEGMREASRIPCDPADARYARSLLRDAALIAESMGPSDRVVLLGSLATSKYLEPLEQALGPRLCFPREFISRGSMSRGSLLLRCVAEGRELEYVSGSAPAIAGPEAAV